MKINPRDMPVGALKHTCETCAPKRFDWRGFLALTVVAVIVAWMGWWSIQ